MTESYRDNPRDQLAEIGDPTHLDGQNAIRKFPPGAYLTTKTLHHDDILLAGWVGLGRARGAASSLIGVLLPGDRIGAILDGRLCTATSLTPVSVAPDGATTDGMREIRHLIRQCVRTCHLGASDRIGDFFLETYQRLEAEGLASHWTFALPLSQATLGNVLGLSTAHVNRVIKQLQAERRIKIAGREITLLDAAGIAVMGMNTSIS